MNEYEELARRKMAGFLPRALQKCANNYEWHIGKIVPSDDHKELKTYHDAGKAVLSHFQMLLRLCAQATDKSMENERDSNDLTSALEEVEAYQSNTSNNNELA